MIVTPERVYLTIPAPVTPRSEGVHLSAIIRCIATETGILDPKWAEELSLIDAREITDPDAVLRICMGLAWEQWYASQLPDVTDHPYEMVLDGIYMTHDGEELSFVRSINRHALIIHEFKLTYKSLKTIGLEEDGNPTKLLSGPKNWMWVSQIKGYCKGAGTRFAVLHVLFVCGDYSWPQTPQKWRFNIEFSQEEIDEGWDLIRDYRDYFQPEN